MSILNPTTDPATQAANQIRNLVRQPFNQMKMSGIQGYNLIWNNRNATPQDIITALGTDAANIFAFAELNGGTLTAAANIDGSTPPVIPSIPPGWTITPILDGTVTATYAPLTSSSSSGTSKKGS